MLGRAAEAIAAHLGDRAVGVVDGQAQIGRCRGEEDQHPVGPHTAATVAERADQVRIDVSAPAATVEEDEVIAQAVVLVERLAHRFFVPAGSEGGGVGFSVRVVDRRVLSRAAEISAWARS
jgi:hypothetical protein